MWKQTYGAGLKNSEKIFPLPRNFRQHLLCKNRSISQLNLTFLPFFNQRPRVLSHLLILVLKYLFSSHQQRKEKKERKEKERKERKEKERRERKVKKITK